MVTGSALKHNLGDNTESGGNSYILVLVETILGGIGQTAFYINLDAFLLNNEGALVTVTGTIIDASHKCDVGCPSGASQQTQG